MSIIKIFGINLLTYPKILNISYLISIIKPKEVLILMFKNKKAQLGILEFKWIIMGIIIGFILALALIYMANKGILIPFRMSFVCP